MPSYFEELLAEADEQQLNTFGSTCTYTPASGSPFSITLVELDPARMSAEADGRYEYRWAHLADFGAVTPAAGDAVTIGAVPYTVIRVKREDGGGGVYLVLEKD